MSNNIMHRSRLIKQQDVVGFDEIVDSSFNADDDKNLYKNYLESGQISWGTVTVVGDAGFVFNGNIGFDLRTGMLTKHLFKPLPPQSAMIRLS
jgi:predicted ATP-dependent Lon-type protease